MSKKIFIDGGTDFFGEELFREYATIKRLVPGWRNRVKKWDLSLMLLRRESSLAHELVREPTWQLWYCDSLAVVLKRSEPSRSSCAPRHADGRKPSEPLGDTNQGESPRKTNPAQQSGLDDKDARQELVGQPRKRMHV